MPKRERSSVDRPGLIKRAQSPKKRGGLSARRKNDEEDIISKSLALARQCRYEKGHSHQVTKISLALFEQLKELHKLDERYRVLLHAAGLLHDIGWIKGRERHHKTARDIIMRDTSLPMTREEKTIVALLARYHRRARPRDSHKLYGKLPVKDKKVVRKLAALLRVADGMDRNHTDNVLSVECALGPGRVQVTLRAKERSEWEQIATEKKADLFEEVFKKDLLVQWTTDD
jgi:exopolyphosphatase/pppGpp-phosphohydrolase